MKSMNGRVLPLSIEKVAPAAPAFLGENPRLEKMFPHIGVLRVLGHVSREGQWGWDGACLEWPSDSSDDPIAIEAVRTGVGTSVGLSQLSFNENGTVPILNATVIDSAVLSAYYRAGDYDGDMGRFIDRDVDEHGKLGVAGKHPVLLSLAVIGGIAVFLRARHCHNTRRPFFWRLGRIPAWIRNVKKCLVTVLCARHCHNTRRPFFWRLGRIPAWIRNVKKCLVTVLWPIR